MLMYETNIDVKDRKRLTIGNFRGIDTASPLFNVDTKRASAMKNFISRDGANHKRYGWKQIYETFKKSGEPLAINGVFDFVVKGKKYSFVYAGTQFYVKDEDGVYIKLEDYSTITTQYNPYKLKSQITKMYVYNDVAYFVGCGDFLCFDGDVFSRVYDYQKTYVPTTTENISCIEQDLDESDLPIVYGDRQTQRKPNIMSASRKNTIIGSLKSTYGSGDKRTYQLDATNINKIEHIDINLENSKVSLIQYGYTGNPEYENLDKKRPLIQMGSKIYLDKYNAHSLYEDIVILKLYNTLTKKYAEVKINHISKQITLRIYQIGGATQNTVIGTIVGTGSFSLLFETSYKRVNDDEGILTETNCDIGHPMFTYVLETSGESSVGREFIKCTYQSLKAAQIVNATDTSEVWGSIDLEKGILSLTRPHSTILGEANIEVRFLKFGEEEDVRLGKITDCRISTLFGVNGNSDTLIVSGNDTYSNYDWWSQPTDFTYFPDDHEFKAGTPNSRIVGYQRLGDDSLAIFKSPNYNEPTVYIRTGTATTIEDDLVKEGYFRTLGSYISNNGAISERCFGMLGNDTLFLSQNGVCSLSIKENIASVTERITLDRSRFINKLLKSYTNEELSKAIAYVYDGKYYLVVGSDCYVADSRYTFTANGDTPDTFNYEWWVWDNCPIRYFFVDENLELCFGTEDGRICKFTKGFQDIELETAQNSVNIQNSKLVSTEVESGEIVHLTTTNADLFQVELTDEDLESNTRNTFVLQNDVENPFKNGEHIKIYAENGVTFEWKECNISDNFGRTITIDAQLSAGYTIKKIYQKCKSNTFVVGESTSANVYELTDIYGRVLDITTANYGSGAITYKLVVEKAQNINAIWYTPVIDCNCNDYIKTMLSLTIATDQITNGSVTFGYETKGADRLIDYTPKGFDARGMDTFDFDNLEFDRFTFDTGFNTAYTRKVKENFNYIIFRFVSNNEYDCCVQNVTMAYKINRRNKGVF